MWVRGVKPTAHGEAGSVERGSAGEPNLRPARLTLGQKVALGAVAVGLVAVGGVLLAAGLALFLALAAGGAVVGAATVARAHFSGRRAQGLLGDGGLKDPAEIEANAAVLPPVRTEGSGPAPT